MAKNKLIPIFRELQTKKRDEIFVYQIMIYLFGKQLSKESLEKLNVISDKLLEKEFDATIHMDLQLYTAGLIYSFFINFAIHSGNKVDHNFILPEKYDFDIWRNQMIKIFNEYHKFSDIPGQNKFHDIPYSYLAVFILFAGMHNKKLSIFKRYSNLNLDSNKLVDFLFERI